MPWAVKIIAVIVVIVGYVISLQITPTTPAADAAAPASAGVRCSPSRTGGAGPAAGRRGTGDGGTCSSARRDRRVPRIAPGWRCAGGTGQCRNSAPLAGWRSDPRHDTGNAKARFPEGPTFAPWPSCLRWAFTWPICARSTDRHACGRHAVPPGVVACLPGACGRPRSGSDRTRMEAVGTALVAKQAAEVGRGFLVRPGAEHNSPMHCRRGRGVFTRG